MGHLLADFLYTTAPITSLWELSAAYPRRRMRRHRGAYRHTGADTDIHTHIYIHTLAPSHAHEPMRTCTQRQPLRFMKVLWPPRVAECP
jgi:hypothetical protein